MEFLNYHTKKLHYVMQKQYYVLYFALQSMFQSSIAIGVNDIACDVRSLWLEGAGMAQ